MNRIDQALEWVAPYWKAVVAFAVPGIALLVTFVTGDEGIGSVTTGEWIMVAVAVLTPVSVYAVVNKPADE